MKKIDWFKQLQTWSFIASVCGLLVYLYQLNSDTAIGFGLGILVALMGLGVWVPDSHADLVTNRKNSAKGILWSMLAVASMMTAAGLLPIVLGFVMSFIEAIKDLSLEIWVIPTLVAGIAFLILSIFGLKMINKEPKVTILSPPTE